MRVKIYSQEEIAAAVPNILKDMLEFRAKHHLGRYSRFRIEYFDGYSEGYLNHALLEFRCDLAEDVPLWRVFKAWQTEPIAEIRESELVAK